MALYRPSQCSTTELEPQPCFFILKDKKTKVYQELVMDLKSYGYPLNSQGIPTRECTWLPPLNEPTVTHQYHCLA